MARDENFLSRWSRRKVAARSSSAPAEPAPAPPPPPAASPPAPPAAARAESAAVPAAPLPDPATLTPESDFTAFMSRDVDAPVRNRALKTLFSDPHFNTMDMLDVYVDDFSKPDPLPPGWLDQLEQVAGLGDRAERDRLAAQRDPRQAAPGEAGAPPAADAPEIAPAQAGEGEREPVSPAGTAGLSDAPPQAAMPPKTLGESGT